MTYTLFDLTYRAARETGLVSESPATGGSTTTLIDTVMLTQGNDYWNECPLWILKDAGGAGAAPEGELRRVSDFVLLTNTLTVDTAFSAAVAAGDRYAVGMPAVQQPVIIQKVNQALQELGTIPVTDTTTITIAANQREYSLPIAANQEIREVWLQQNSTDSNDNEWTRIYDWHIQQSATGTADLLVLNRQLDTGYKLKVIYMAPHPAMYSSTDKLSEHVPVERVVLPAALYIMEYRKTKSRWSDWEAEIARMERRVNDVMVKAPIYAPPRTDRLMYLDSRRTSRYPGDRNPR